MDPLTGLYLLLILVIAPMLLFIAVVLLIVAGICHVNNRKDVSKKLLKAAGISLVIGMLSYVIN
jgi:Na+/H+-dicarboxylate symporter